MNRLTLLVKNKFLVSLNASTNLSASINHSLSSCMGSSPCILVSILLHRSCALAHPLSTSFSFSASSSLNCAWVSRFWGRALVPGAVFVFTAARSSWNSDVDAAGAEEPGVGADTASLGRFLRESITKEKNRASPLARFNDQRRILAFVNEFQSSARFVHNLVYLCQLHFCIIIRWISQSHWL